MTEPRIKLTRCGKDVGVPGRLAFLTTIPNWQLKVGNGLLNGWQRDRHQFCVGHCDTD